MIDLRQTREYARYMESLRWEVGRWKGKDGIENYVYIKQIPLFGKVAKSQRPNEDIDFEALDSWCKKNKIAVLYVEPTLEVGSWKLEAGFRQAKTCFLPAKTIQIDLVQNEKQLLSQMKPKTRYNIKIATKNGVVVKQSDSIDLFVNLWQRSANKRGMFLSQKKEIKALYSAFGSKAYILFAYPKKNVSRISYLVSPVAGVLLARTETTAHYMYAFSTNEGKKNFAPTHLVWEAIKLVKSKKCKIFDFEGIYDPRYPQTKSWRGFTKFKEGFGGKVVEYPATLVRPYGLLASSLYPFFE